MGMFTHTVEGWHSFLIFFSLRTTQLALPHCFVLFLEVAEPAFRQSGIKKNPFSLSHMSAVEGVFRSSRTVKGHVPLPDLSPLLALTRIICQHVPV